MTRGAALSRIRVPFLDLRVDDGLQRRRLLHAIEGVMRHGRFIIGPEVSILEKKIARVCGRRFAIGVGSGTDALFLGLKSMGIGPGDEVITTSLSWIATANAIAMTGATPVFADIGTDLNIDPASVSRLLSRRTKAILPVHYTGRVCGMDKLLGIGRAKNIPVVEDASQAFSATFKGQPAGSFGLLGCFSMNPMKILGACGEAGMIVLDRIDLRNRLLALRYNGTVNREICLEPSINSRLDTIQAAMLLERLRHVGSIVRKRRAIAAYYEKSLSDVVKFPRASAEAPSVYYTFTLLAERRDELKVFLEQQGVESRVQHPILMPDQPAYKTKVKGEFANAKRLVAKILCIPAHENLTEHQVEYVARQIRAFYERRKV
jgi:dTDP-4-amino-4,6-dideoxygalactose transaminase